MIGHRERTEYTRGFQQNCHTYMTETPYKITHDSPHTGKCRCINPLCPRLLCGPTVDNNHHMQGHGMKVHEQMAL